MAESDAPWAGYDEEYREFQRAEDVPIHTGHHIDDVRTVAVDDWERTGGRGAFINLEGMEGFCDIQVVEIPPTERLNAQRHLHEALVFVVQGSGLTTIGSAGEETTFEWSDGAHFFLPQNVEYRHVSTDEDGPTRLLSITPLPLYYTLHKEHEAIWDVDCYDKWSLIEEEGFYRSSATLEQGGAGDGRVYWVSNFIPDITRFDKLEAWPERGGGGRSVHFPFRETAMYTHISEFQKGRYKKAHRHLSGANVMVLSGEGYSYLWKDEFDDGMRIDWTPYTLFTPPTMWYHQHFNTSTEYARYVAFHGPLQGTGLVGSGNDLITALNPDNQIEYEDEDPRVRREFQRELDENGIENRMEPGLYEP